MQQLVADLHDRLGCNYTVDIQAIFVESSSQCTSFRIGATITSNSASVSCHNPSIVEKSLSHWTSSYGTVQKYIQDCGDRIATLKVRHPTSVISLKNATEC